MCENDCDGPSLILRPSISRPVHWSEIDYDVYAGEYRVGRIFRAEDEHPEARPWMWTIEFHERRGAGPHQGFAVSRDAAMKTFRACWKCGHCANQH